MSRRARNRLAHPGGYAAHAAVAAGVGTLPKTVPAPAPGSPARASRDGVEWGGTFLAVSRVRRRTIIRGKDHAELRSTSPKVTGYSIRSSGGVPRLRSSSYPRLPWIPIPPIFLQPSENARNIILQ